jgi:hypothetical protein
MNYAIQKTKIFSQWHTSLRDMRARIAIARRIERASAGNLGDVKSVGEGVSEMRVEREQATASISPFAASRSSFCWWAATNQHSLPISGKQK